MKAVFVKPVAIALASVVAIGALGTFEAKQADKVSASGVVDNKVVLEESYAGVAKYLEVDSTPSKEEILKIAEENSWKQPGALIMANVSCSVNVRSEADSESEVIGKLYNDCGGYIVEYTDTWTKIVSGNMEGWVCNDYLFFGEEADKKANDVGCYHATIVAETVRVREAASTDSKVLGLVANGEVFDVVEETDDWIIVDYEGANGYLSKDFAEVEFVFDTGETIDEINAREEAKKAAAKESTASAGNDADRYQDYGQYAASVSDRELLGALIQCEAGNQPYEGQVAVGAVVMNRVRSGAYPDTIYGVIYASGQFTPAGSGAVDRRIANGVNASCLQAADEALSGYSNVGEATHFRPTGRHDGIVIAGHVFW